MSKEDFIDKWTTVYSNDDDFESLKSYMRSDLDELIKELNQHDVDKVICDNCQDVQGMYLGMTCPKCNRSFRAVRQTDL
jgi:hypothetical protein